MRECLCFCGCPPFARVQTHRPPFCYFCTLAQQDNFLPLPFFYDLLGQSCCAGGSKRTRWQTPVRRPNKARFYIPLKASRVVCFLSFSVHKKQSAGGDGLVSASPPTHPTHAVVKILQEHGETGKSVVTVAAFFPFMLSRRLFYIVGGNAEFRSEENTLAMAEHQSIPTMSYRLENEGRLEVRFNLLCSWSHESVTCRLCFVIVVMHCTWI